ncbi:MAG TPA: hypothetical protein VJR23_05295 [Candidatus Acidoferrales bacterium]|nr:hypothetical protein [Candidatus Acidoferrales bacterium]
MAQDDSEDRIQKSEAGTPLTSAPTPQKITEALEKVRDPDAKLTLSVALSRTSYGFGPDPETAKIICDGEIHEENCRLEAYKASLLNRDKQSERDHDFRKRQLNRDFSMSITVLILALFGSGAGLFLIIKGNTAIGSNILIAGVGLILYILKGPEILSKK